MRGLCIVDELSEYSQVAQGIFRLRKINMGHTIHFLLLNKNVNSEELLEILDKNERISKNDKKAYLTYQTIKSEIRKETNIYIEPVKYYHLDYQTNIYKILTGIMTEKEISDNELGRLFAEISDIEIIKKIVYNLDSVRPSTQQSIESENEQAKAISTETKFLLYHKRYNILLYELFYDYKTYDFNILKSDFIQGTIRLTDSIHFLPNIFTNSNTYRHYYNESGCLFVYFRNVNKILIIPGYLFMYFKEYPILNYKALLLNKELSSDFMTNKQRILNIYEKEDLLKILNNIPVVRPDSLSTFVASSIINNLNLITDTQKAILQSFDEKKIKVCIGIILKQFNTEYFNSQKVTYIANKTIGLKINELILPDVVPHSVYGSRSGWSDGKDKTSSGKSFEITTPVGESLAKYYNQKAMKYKFKYLRLKGEL